MISRQRIGRVAYRVAAVVGMLCLLEGSAAIARGSYPPEISRLFDFAEQEAFAGNFDAASERIKEVRAWIAQPENQQQLRRAGIKWSNTKAVAEAFDGWIAAEKGDLSRAALLLKDAQVALNHLEDIAYVALVNLQLGDFEFAQSFAGIGKYRMPVELQEGGEFRAVVTEGQRHFKRAKKYYEKAADIFINALDGDERDLSDTAKKLRGRAENSLARCEIVEGDFMSAARHLQEAERLYRATAHHDEFVAPGRKWPVTLKEMRRKSAEDKNLDPKLKHWYLTEYARTVCEWLRLLGDQTELGIQWQTLVEDAEKTFSKARDMSEENLGRAHPFRYRCDLSLAKFYISKAIEAADQRPRERDPEAAQVLQNAEKSYFLDAAFCAQDTLNAIQNERKLLPTHPVCFEALVLELVAHDAGYSLSGRTRQDVVADMEKWVADQKANKRVPKRGVDVSEVKNESHQQ